MQSPTPEKRLDYNKAWPLHLSVQEILSIDSCDNAKNACILLLAARGCYSFIHSSLSLFLNASMKAPPWSACPTKISIHSWTRRAFGHLPNHVPTQGKSSGRAVSWWFGAAFSDRGNNPPFLHPWTLTFYGPAIGRCGLFEGMATCSNLCVS